MEGINYLGILWYGMVYYYILVKEGEMGEGISILISIIVNGYLPKSGIGNGLTMFVRYLPRYSRPIWGGCKM